jgi:pantoate kinase
MLSVTVSHRSGLIIGAGFGASGAGALGTAIALGNVLDSAISVERAGQFAHVAEVMNRTGLGDVIAQTLGGAEVRTRPGAPGIGAVARIESPNGLKVILAGASGIETREVLSNEEKRNRINKIGDMYVRELINAPTFENLMHFSQEFANAASLMTDRVRTAVHELRSSDFQNCSMVMLGDSLFCFCSDNEVPRVRSIVSKYWTASSTMTTSVSNSGGRLIE